MLRATQILKSGALCALFALITALAPAKASAQCCDLIVDIAPNIPCCINIINTLWSDGWHPGGDYCNPIIPTRISVPCPNEFLGMTIQTASGPLFIAAEVAQYPVKISDNCCVHVFLAKNLPCNLISIRPVACS